MHNAEPNASQNDLMNFLASVDSRLSKRVTIPADLRQQSEGDHPLFRAVGQAAEAWRDGNAPVVVSVAEECATLVTGSGRHCNEAQIGSILLLATRVSKDLATAVAACSKCFKAFQEVGSAAVNGSLKVLSNTEIGDPSRAAALEGTRDMMGLIRLLKESTERTLAGEGKTFWNWEDRTTEASNQLAAALTSLGPQLLGPADAFLKDVAASQNDDQLAVIWDALRKLDDAAVLIQPLIVFAERTRQGRRQNALLTVAYIGGGDAAQALCTFMRQHSASGDVEAVNAAAQGLDKLRPCPAVAAETPTFLELLSSVDEISQPWIVDALGRVGDDRAVPPLKRFRDTRRPLSLFRFGDNKYVFSQSMRYRAGEALKNLQNRP